MLHVAKKVYGFDSVGGVCRKGAVIKSKQGLPIG